MGQLRFQHDNPSALFDHLAADRVYERVAGGMLLHAKKSPADARLP
ncbi:hypothetical protein HMPREF9413_3732 [Paenibacillus sp. HGF7]|nr:hypothetical protein HMPREF9413_3732 [Paenibacillus sp. HGF7]